MAWNLSERPVTHDLPVLSLPRNIGPGLIDQYQGSNVVPHVFSKLKQFRDEGLYCDLEIQVHAKLFLAHKVVLAAWSPLFASTLCNSSKNSGRQLAVVSCENILMFEDFLDLIYSGNYVPTESNVQHLIDIATKFRVESVLEDCQNFLKHSANLRNFVSRYFLSMKYGLKPLEEYLMEFVKGNIADIIQQKAVASLTPSEFYTFICTGTNRMLVREVKFSLILGWVSGNVEERERYLMFLLGQIDWTEPVSNLLMEISCSENVFMSSEFCLFQLLQTILRHGHDLGHFAAVYPRLSHSYGYSLEDLMQPNMIQPTEIFPAPSNPVSVLIDSSQNVPGRKKALGDNELKDVSVATDIDSTFFENLDLQQETEKAESEMKDNSVSTVSASNGNCQNSPTDSEPNDELVEKVVDKACLKVTLKIKKPSLVERQKKRGRPRKTMDGIRKKSALNKVHRGTKRRCGRLKKSSSKTNSVQTPDLSKVKVEIQSDDEMEDDTPSLLDTDGLQIGVDDDDDDDDDDDLESNVKDELSSNGSSTSGTPGAKRRKSKSTSSQSTGRQFSCDFEGCNYVTKIQSRVEKHVEKVHKSNCKLKCFNCNFETPLMRELCIHLKQHYFSVPYKCDKEDCSFETIVLRRLVYHLMEHNGETPYSCDLCDKSFRTLNRLSCHRKLHSNLRYTCDICGRSFSTKGCMKTHRAIHFDQKPYLCDTCGFTTKHQSHLITHRKIHTGELLNCTFENCNYSTPKQGHMTQHMNVHLNIRDHICQVCGKSFTVRGKLLRHELIHLDQKLFKCKMCDYRTSRTDRMKLHVTSHGFVFDPNCYEKA